MAEAGEEFAAEAGAPPPIDADAGLAAAALSVARKQRDGGADDRLDAFLDKQGRLIDVQLEHLHEQRELILSRLRWGRFSDRMKAGLRTARPATVPNAWPGEIARLVGRKQHRTRARRQEGHIDGAAEDQLFGSVRGKVRHRLPARPDRESRCAHDR